MAWGMNRTTRWSGWLGKVVAALAMLQCALAWANPYLRPEISQHTAAVRRIAVSPDESLIATVSDDKTGRIWRAADRRLMAVLRVPIGPADIGRLYGVAFAPDGRSVAVAGTNGAPDAPHRIDIFDTGNGAHLRTLALDAGNVVRLLWTRDGRHLAACLSGRNGLRILTAQGRTVLSEDHAGACYALAQRPDGSLLQAGLDGMIREYRAVGDTWTLARRIPVEGAEPLSIAVSPDGVHFAVGYRSPIQPGRIAVDVFDAAQGTRARRFWFTDQRFGSLGSVAWSRDGRTIAASGRATNDDGGRVRVVIKRIAWPDGAVQSDFVATDTIQDMAAVGADRFAIASSNGSWAEVRAVGPVDPLGATVLDLRGADTLRTDADARTVSFGGEGWSGASTFGLRRRELVAGEAQGLETSRRVSGRIGVAQWKNHPRPSIAGRPVAMGAVELSRSVALLPDDAGAVLGTTHTLRRFDRDGRQLWSVTAPAEVTSLNVALGGRVVASTLNDGTVRWWRAEDGALLLSLFATPDRRWVLWTEHGYYDASPGAEALIGWHLNRVGGAGADFFSMGRYREMYHRPDVIDQVLDTLDVPRALAQADAHRKIYVDADTSAHDAAGTSVAPPVAQVVKPAPSELLAPVLVPPVVSSVTQRSQVTGQRDLRIDFSVRAGTQSADAMVVRLDGRPTEPILLSMPERQDGVALGTMILRMPERSAEVAVMARAGQLHSEPVRLSWLWMAPAVAAVPAAPQPPPQAPAAASEGTTPVTTSASVAASNSTKPIATPAPASTPSAASAGHPLADARTAPSSLRPLPLSVLDFPQSELNRPPAPPTPVDGPPRAAYRLNQAATALRSARLFVLAVGVSKYARREYSLALAAKDAADVDAVFRGNAGRLYSSVESRLLTDERATRAAVLSGLEWLRKSAGPDDTAILFIAGHGVNDARGRYFFLPHDADVAQLSRTGVGEAEIRSTLAAVRGRAMLFADTCHSGNVIGTGLAAGAELGRLANTLSSSETGVIVFSASTGRQESIEAAEWGNGAFTKALLSGLKGQADFRKDGVVTHQGLSYYLGREVVALTRGRQTPVTAVPIGVVDFPLIAAAQTQ